MTDEHWIITLYERYVQLYGDPIEQPITPADHNCTHESPDKNASPMNKDRTAE